jgi:hypothetical protein
MVGRNIGNGKNQCCGSMKFLTDPDADPYLWLNDPDPGPVIIFLSDLQDLF